MYLIYQGIYIFWFFYGQCIAVWYLKESVQAYKTKLLDENIVLSVLVRLLSLDEHPLKGVMSLNTAPCWECTAALFPLIWWTAFLRFVHRFVFPYFPSMFFLYLYSSEWFPPFCRMLCLNQTTNVGSIYLMDIRDYVTSKVRWF